MNLYNIKSIAEKKRFTLTSICDKINMSTANLHKCIRDNRIEAGDLEQIAQILEVPITSFFDEFEPVLDPNYAEILDLQRKYIASLEKRLEEYEGKPAKKAS